MHAILFSCLAGLCWGVGELFTRSVLHSGKVGPLTAIAVRSTIALPVLWGVWYFVACRPQREPAAWLQAGAGVLAKLTLGSGLIAGAGGMIFFYLALSMGEVGKVKPIAFTIAPATAVILGCAVLGEPLTLRKVVAVLLVLGGVLLLTSK